MRPLVGVSVSVAVRVATDVTPSRTVSGVPVTIAGAWSSSASATVVPAGLPASTHEPGISPRPSTTLSPSSSTPSSMAVTVTVCASGPPGTKVTLGATS